jgi:hypothetical protein
MRQNSHLISAMAQNHLQPSSPKNKRPLSSNHQIISTNTDAGATDGITSMMGNSVRANNIPTPNRVIRRAASVDDDSVYVGREKYQHRQLLPNRLLFRPPSPHNLCSDKGSYGRANAANNGATRDISFDIDEKRTESSTQAKRQVVPQDRSFLHDNEEDATTNNTSDATARSLIFRRSPTTQTTLEQPLLQQQREATPVNFLASSSPFGTFSIPGIRPSLSCPTSLFDSPLLPIGASTNQQRQQHIMPCPSNDTDTATDRLNAVDVSVIQYCEDDDDVTPSEDNRGEEINRAAVVNPMRNLSDTFELLVASENDTSKKQQRPKQSVRDTFTSSSSTCDVTFEDKSAATTSTSSTSTKPSPTSVLGFDTVDSSSLRATKKGETLQLENGITVLRMSLPRFQLHEDLCGEMHQGLIDRVSFYSIVRDINKEAADAAMTDPKGQLYNDEAMHQGGGVSNNVNAKDGKVHTHPIRSMESNNILVVACMENREESWKPSMGVALLDEEWWLLSAMASRSPEEVALNQASALPSTFSEALGEKDSSTGDSMSTSKTQLWKPGRSWWEAKSGKNPWVEPAVHNNRWR